MNTHESVHAWLTGALSPEERSAFEAQLETDQELQKEVAKTEKLLKLLKAAPEEEVSHNLAPQILASIRNDADKTFSIRAFLPFAAAAAIVLYLLIGFSPEERTVSEQPAPEALAALQNGNRMTLDDACQWLSDHQQKDGSWDVAALGGEAGHKDGLAGLALMALLEKPGAFAQASYKAIGYLLTRQSENGLFGSRHGKPMYNHGIITTALLRAHAVYPSEQTQGALRKAFIFMMRSQTKDGGWGYYGVPGEVSNTAVTAWQLQALYEAKKLGWRDAALALKPGSNFVRALMDKQGKISYDGKAPGAAPATALSAMGAFCLVVDPDVEVRKHGVKILEAAVKACESNNSRKDAYRDYFLAQAVKVLGDSAMEERLSKLHPMPAREELSSLGNLSQTRVGGSVYTTAMMALTRM